MDDIASREKRIIDIRKICVCGVISFKPERSFPVFKLNDSLGCLPIYILFKKEGVESKR